MNLRVRKVTWPSDMLAVSMRVLFSWNQRSPAVGAMSSSN